MSSKKLNETEYAAVVEWKLCDVNLVIPAVSQTCMLILRVCVHELCVQVYGNCLHSHMQGRFVGVVGKVGTGKSSLLAAITAEMRKVSGQVEQYLLCCCEYNKQKKMQQNVQKQYNIIYVVSVV